MASNALDILDETEAPEIPAGTALSVIDSQPAAIVSQPTPGRLESLGMGVMQGYRDIGIPLLRGTNALLDIAGGNQFMRDTLQSNIDARDDFNRTYGRTGFGAAGRMFGNIEGTVPAMMVGGEALAASRLGRIVSPWLAHLEATGAGGVNAALQAARVPFATPITNALLSGARGAAQGGVAAAMTSGASDAPTMDQVASGMKLGGGLGVAGPAAQAIAGGARNMLVGEAVDPMTVDLANNALQRGIRVRGSQISESRPVKLLDSILQRTPFSGMHQSDEEIKDAFNRSISRTIGMDTDQFTSQGVRQAKRDIGQRFENVAASVTNMATPQLMNDLMGINNRLLGEMSAEEAAPIIRNIQNIYGMIAENGGTLSGDGYLALTKFGSPLARLASAKNSTMRQAAGDVRAALDGALSQASQPAMQQELAEARAQWNNYITLQPLLKKARGADNQISPNLLFQRVQNRVRNFDTTDLGENDLVDLAIIGRRFATPAGTSHTAENAAMLGTGAAIGNMASHPTNPQSYQWLLNTLGALGAGRAAGSALRSDWYRNMLLNPAPAPAAAGNPLFGRVAIPAAVALRPALSPVPAN